MGSIAEIMTVLRNMQDESSEKFVEAVMKRLEGFGCSVKQEDAWPVAYCIQKVNRHIMNACNTPAVPDGLFNAAVDRVCGEVLFSLQQSGKLELENLDFDAAITQIHEGDTTIQFASGSSNCEKFALFVNQLMREGDGDFVCYRKIRW